MIIMVAHVYFTKEVATEMTKEVGIYVFPCTIRLYKYSSKNILVVKSR